MRHRSLQHASRNPLNVLPSTFRRCMQARMFPDMRFQQKLPLSLLRNRERSRCLLPQCFLQPPLVLVAVPAICVKALAVFSKPLLYPHAPYTPFL